MNAAGSLPMPQYYQFELRAETRLPVSLQGVLTLDAHSTPCHIRNMCSRGFLIESGSGVPVGRSVRLRCEPYPGRVLECTVEVRHVNAQCLGARVVAISEDGLRLAREFLQERQSAALAAATRH